MKKHLLIGLALLIGVIGCSVQETDHNSAESVKLVFQAAPFLNGDDSEETKTGVIPNANYSSYSFIWSAKDTVGIFPSQGNQIAFSMASGAGASSATFDGGAWTCKDGYTYRSYFPLVGKFYLDPKKIPVSFIGQKQVGNANSDHFQKFDYMYAPLTTKQNGFLNFSYKHLITAVLPWVDLPAGHYVGLTLSLDEPLFLTEGEYDLTAASPAIVGKAYSNRLFISLDITLTEPGTLIVYVPMAPIDMRGKTLTIVITAEGGVAYAYTYNPGKAYTASNIYRLRSAASFLNGDVILDREELTLAVGQSQQLTATVMVEGASDKTVTWTSSNTDVATVDQNGNVMAIQEGTATVTATAAGKSASCQVTVMTVPATGISLNRTSLELKMGDSFSLIATLLPTNSTDKVIWSSSDDYVVSVDQNGKITANHIGQAFVYARVSQYIYATCSVLVPVDTGGNEGIGYDEY